MKKSLSSEMLREKHVEHRKTQRNKVAAFLWRTWLEEGMKCGVIKDMQIGQLCD
jgi:hypothetical protein